MYWLRLSYVKGKLWKRPRPNSMAPCLTKIYTMTQIHIHVSVSNSGYLTRSESYSPIKHLFWAHLLVKVEILGSEADLLPGSFLPSGDADCFYLSAAAKGIRSSCRSNWATVKHLREDQLWKQDSKKHSPPHYTEGYKQTQNATLYADDSVKLKLSFQKRIPDVVNLQMPRNVPWKGDISRFLSIPGKTIVFYFSQT